MSTTHKQFLDPQKRIDLAVADIQRRIKYAGLVTMIDGEAFVGTTNGNGEGVCWFETEAVTVARDYDWRTRTRPVQYDEIFRSKLAIIINKHMTQGVRWTAEEDWLDEISYARDILKPSTTALARRLNAKIETALLNASDMKVTNLSLGAVGDYKGEDVLRQALNIQATLDESGMPAEGRKLLVGSKAFVHIAASGAMVKYDPAAATTAYRKGVVGEIADMEVVNASSLLGDTEFRVVHPSWAIMPTAAGNLPQSGVQWAAKASIDGISARLLRHYDPAYDREGSVLHTYWNINELKDEIDRHTRASAEALGDGSVAGDPKIDDDELVHTGKNVRIAKGLFTVPTAP